MGLSAASWVFFGLAAAGWFVNTWELVQLWRLRRIPLIPPPRWPSFSILKPMAGLDDELLENLESHLRIDYPGPWRLLLGVRSEQDPAHPIARAFVDAHPERAELHLQEGEPGFNPKVNQLITLTRYATGEVIALTDSNVRVKPTVLREHASRLAEPKVGLTSNLFVGVGEQSVGSAFDHMTLNAFGMASCATAELTLGMTQLIGKSMAVKREVLAELGGWETVKDLLAEDQRFGFLLAQKGHETRLCPTPVENVQLHAPFGHFWGRHARWAMIRFRVIPAVWFEPLMNPMIWALACALASPFSPQGWAMVFATGTFAIAFTQLATRLLRGHPFALKWAILIPLHDLIFLAVWFRGMTMRTVTWRGNALRVLKKTRLEPVK